MFLVRLQLTYPGDPPVDSHSKCTTRARAGSFRLPYQRIP